MKKTYSSKFKSKVALEAIPGNSTIAEIVRLSGDTDVRKYSTAIREASLRVQSSQTR